MPRVLTSTDVETIVGTASPMILLKQVASLDEDCVRVLAASPLAGFGHRDSAGIGYSTFIGGKAGFTRVHSPTRISFAVEGVRDDRGSPVVGGGVSMVFMLPGVGETLRVNGVVSRRTRTRVTVEVQEAYIHCARCVMRSGLWSTPGPEALDRDGPHGGLTTEPASAPEVRKPLAQPAVRDFLGRSSFLVVSSWDARGGSDTSPRGDPAGFVQVLDGRTLAIPDRKGNRRADTFHNVLQDRQVSLAALVPGRDEVLHLRGTALVTDDAPLLATMAVGGRPPQAALVIEVDEASIGVNAAVRRSAMWERRSHVDRSTIPDMTAAGARHIAASTSPGRRAWGARALTRVLGRLSPALLEWMMDIGYRRQLRQEGYRADRVVPQRRRGTGRAG